MNIFRIIKQTLMFLLLCISLNAQTSIDNNIILTPITSAYLFDNFYDSLYPFMYSKKVLKIDNKTNLKLLDEIEYYNGFYGDILKVKVASGKYQGEIGYILEESLALTPQSIKNGVKLFFKNEVIIDNIFKINKDTQCSVIDSRTENYQEILTLQFLSSPIKNLVIRYKNKNDLHFIINKTTEIYYHLRKGHKVIKVVNSNSLQPIQNASIEKNVSDEHGLIYIDENTKQKIFIIEKEGFTDGIVMPSNERENLFLCFISPLEQIRHLDENMIIYKKENYSFIISNEEKSVFNKTGIGILDKNNLSIFCFPFYENKDFVVSGGFFITNTKFSKNISCKINIDNKNHYIIYFDTNLLKWIDIPFIKNNNEVVVNNIKDGFYLVVSESEDQIGEAKLILDKNIKLSQIFIRNEKGNYYSQISKDVKNEGKYEVLMPKDKCEIVFFTPESPTLIFQNFISYNNYDITMEVDDFLNNKNNNQQKLSRLFYGKWYRRIIRVDQNIIKDNDNKINLLEFLGDMEIESANKVSFSNKDYQINGHFEIIDNRKLNIHIDNVDRLVTNNDGSYFFNINPSLFNSQFVIPAYYSFKAGIFQISFDTIFFTRKKLFNDKAKDDLTIKMESTPFGYPYFPSSEEKSRYQLYFTQ